MAAWIRFALFSVLALALCQPVPASADSSSTGSDEKTRPRVPALQEIPSARPLAGGAVADAAPAPALHSTAATPKGWAEQVQKDLREREYDVTWQAKPVVEGVGASWHAPNRAQGFRTYFTPEGIRVVPRTEAAPSWRWGLSLVGYGRGETTWTVPQARLSPSGHRLEYQRGSIEERYENTAAGLEQLFLLSTPPAEGGKSEAPAKLEGRTTPLARPARQANGPGSPIDWIHLDLALWGDLLPRVSEDGQAIDFVTPSGAPVLHYAQLRVTDARGAVLSSWMEGFVGEKAHGIRMVIDARTAVYPIAVDPLATSPAWTAESDQANALFGASVSTAGDVNGDGYSDVIVGAYFYDNGQTDEGRAFVYLGSASGLSATPAWTAESDQAGADFGYSVSTAGDVNHDGYSDVIIGADGFDNGQTDEGRAYVYLGSASGLSTTPAWTAESDEAGALFGAAVSTAGDVNGDGYSDVIVGAYRYDYVSVDDGLVYVYLGSASGLSTTPAWTVTGGVQGGTYFGASVSTAGDVNGDGYSDVIVGAYRYDTSSVDDGKAFVYLGSASGLATTPAWTAEGNQANAPQFGNSVATAGDVNGDGYSDVIVGAYEATDSTGHAGAGKAYVYLGSASGLATTPSWTVMGSQIEEHLGISVATAGDVNGDGYSDVIVGAPNYDNGQTDKGQAYVYLGSASGLSTTPTWTGEGNQAGASFGGSVATAGDVNGDGFSDIIVGAPYYDNGQTDQGQAYVYLGSGSSVAVLPSWSTQCDQAGEDLGWSVASAGDVNGDGYSDVIIGAPDYDNGQTDEGKALLFLGSASGLATSPAWMAEGNLDGISFGGSVASAGDVNGDGYSDVIIGASGFGPENTAVVGSGSAYVYLGSPVGLAATPAWTVAGEHQSDEFGNSVASAGDVNGDGFSDVIVGAPGFDNGANTNEGRAYLYLGSAAGLGTTPAWLGGSGLAQSQFGHSVASAGDINGDGYSDVIVGASNYNDGVNIRGGRVYLFLGSPSGVPATPAWTQGSPNLGDEFGFAVATAGDVNGDGYADLLVGAFAPVGYADLYLGSPSGTLIFSWRVYGFLSDNLGASVASAGDVNGDGYGDVIVSAAGLQVYIYHGSAAGLPSTPSLTLLPPGDSGEFGDSVASAGDVNGDGYADVIVGATSGFPGGIGAVVYYGNNGGGRFSFNPRQGRTDDTAPITLLGESDSQTAFRLNADASFGGSGTLSLQWEVKPLGTPFNGTGLGSSTPQEIGPRASVKSASSFSELVSGLSEGTFYHWRARVVSSDPLFPHSPWMSLQGNSITETKFRTAGCVDRDGDGYGAMGDPSCLSLTPDCNDSSATAWGTPGETGNLHFTSSTDLSWNPPAAPGAATSALLYDTLRSPSAGDFLSPSVVCIESDNGPDTTATDSAVPALGQVFFYLNRAQDSCPSGQGPLGNGSSGTPRQGRTCP
jgi:FG-GAP repeat protein/VCBS repeat protein